MSDETEKVETIELDPEAARKIAAEVNATEPAWAKSLREQNEAQAAELAAMKAIMSQPQRTMTEPEAGKPAAKSNDAPRWTGGHDKYTSAGGSDADRAVNLYLVKTLIETPDPRTGTRARASERLHQVMIAAADAALKSGDPDVPEFTAGSGGASKHVDPSRFTAATFKSFREEARSKAMTSTGANAGDEWVPTFASSELWRDVHLATTIASQIRRTEMPTNPYTLPTLDADVTYYYASTENTAVTVSNLNTGNATLTAKKIQAEVNFSGELTEDSIIPIAAEIRANLVRRGAQTIDDLIVHGDTETGGTGNVNTDDAAPASGAFYTALDGMRKFCLVTNTGQVKQFAGAPSSTLFLNTRALLGKYGARPSDLLLVTGFSTINAFMDLDDFQTLDKYGANAVVVTGELGRIYGIPALLSEAIPGTSTDKVDDDGKYTTTSVSTNDTDGWIVLANKTQWRAGFRRELQVESFRDIQKDMNILVASFRMALIPSGIATTHTAVGYDITVL